MQVTFHEFSMGDVDDVDIYVAQPIYEWQQTDKGRWVMSNVRDVKYYTSPDVNTMGYMWSYAATLKKVLCSLNSY